MRHMQNGVVRLIVSVSSMSGTRPAETSLTTGLALKTQDSQYTIGVSTADGKVSWQAAQGMQRGKPRMVALGLFPKSLCPFRCTLL